MAAAGWVQKEVSFGTHKRGNYLVTDSLLEQLPEIAEFQVGLLHLFMRHTSAALTINENYDPDAAGDIERAMDHLVAERGGIKWRHTMEGADDSPAHVKASLFGASVTIPISEGRLNLGTWQGVHLYEFRNAPHRRVVVATIQGVRSSSKERK